MSAPCPLHQRYLDHMQAARRATDLGLFERCNAPRPPLPGERWNERAERAGQIAIAALLGALIVYGYGADAAAALLGRV